MWLPHLGQPLRLRGGADPVSLPFHHALPFASGFEYSATAMIPAIQAIGVNPG